MSTMTAIVNPFPPKVKGGQNKKLVAWKNTIKPAAAAGGIKPAQLSALSNTAYQQGLLAGRKAGRESEKNKDKRKKSPFDNPTSFSDAMDMAKAGLIGGAGAVGVDLIAGTLASKLNLNVDPTNATYMLFKLGVAYAIGEALSVPTNDMSYVAATGSIAASTRDFVRAKIAPSLPAGGTVRLGQAPQLPTMRVVPAPVISGVAGMQTQQQRRVPTVRPRGMST